MIPYLLVLFLATAAPAKPAPEDNVADALAHAEALYYGARFNEAVDLLSRIDGLLQPEDQDAREKAAAKLYLALAYIGLNQLPEAQSALRDLFVMNPDYRLDGDQYSPKVVELAAAARNQATGIRCRNVEDKALKMLGDNPEPAAILGLITPMRPQCPGLAQMEPRIGDLFYKKGADLYKRGELSDALGNFRQAAALSPGNDLAREYIELAQGKLQVQADRVFLSWREHFESKDVKAAAQDYRDLLAMDRSNGEQFQEIRAEYRKSLFEQLDSWNQACAKGDRGAMTSIRQEASGMLPDASVGADIIQQMGACVPAGCIEMTAALAMARLKTRVNPEVPPKFRSAIQNPITIRVKARIDEGGNVTVSGTEGGRPELEAIMRAAVERWKFSPILDGNGARCVDTTIPFVVRP